MRENAQNTHFKTDLSRILREFSLDPPPEKEQMSPTFLFTKHPFS